MRTLVFNCRETWWILSVPHIRLSNTAKTNGGTFTGKSADVTYAPATPGDPAMISVRVQLKKRNENYGQLSDIAALTVNP